MGEAKRKNQRHCPALDTIISSIDCGSGRNSKIDCPAGCPHNPFSAENYLTAFSALEDKLIHRLMGLLARELSPVEAREIARSRDVFTIHALHVWHVHGRNLVGRWRQAGEFARWSNDDRVMLDCYGTIRVALVETLHVIDGISVLARDLLQPDLDPFRLIDASSAAQVGRYNLLLGWIYRVPAGWRSSGAGVSFPDTLGHEPEEAFEILLEHLDAPSEHRENWLLEHMTLLHEAITAIAQARKQRMIELSDTRAITRSFGASGKRIRSLLEALARHPRCPDDQKPEPGDLFSGSLLEREAGPEEIVKSLGRITVRDEGVELWAMGMANAERLRDFVLELAPGLELIDESVEDLRERIGETGPPRQDNLVPAAFLEDVAGVEVSSRRMPAGISSELALMTETLRRLPDDRIPAIGNLTPRQAAADPAMRPALVRLMKGHIRNIDRLRCDKGLDLDLNPILLELGLDELVQPPPPLGEATARPDEPDLTPPPPQPLLAGEDLQQRLTRAFIEQTGSGHEERRLADFLDEIENLPEAGFSDEELLALRMCARFSIGTMHPKLPHGFLPDIGRMTAWYDEMLDSGDDGSSDEEYYDRILDGSTQPELASQVMTIVFEVMGEAGDRVRDEVVAEFVTALAAAIRETAHWPVMG